jgi:type IV pilus assembly protein PilV
MLQTLHRHRQAGSSLLESLIAITIFSIGLLGLVATQARSIVTVGDAEYRSDAANLADQIIGQMWADRANLGAYANYPNVGATTCAPGGAPSANANVTHWLIDVQNALPGAPANQQQISMGANNIVTVTLCWKASSDSASHNFVATAQING